MVFAWIMKNQFFSSRFCWFWYCDLRTDPFERIFIKEFNFCSMKTCVRLLKENLFYSNNTPEIHHIFNFWWHQKLLLIAKQFKIVTLLFESNSEDSGISKLISQLKILPSLFELKDNDTIVMSTINKLQHISQNKGFLISEIGKIIRFLLLSQATNAVKAPFQFWSL